ncbi:MAG: hypothetical protein OXC41_03580 [Gammaproteobacteria bacterium]|nr:hypothetical protein [Gammaproteobacteria bacterium]
MGRKKSYPVSEWARLIYDEGLSVQQVAHKFNVSAKVVRIRMYRAGYPKMRDWKRKTGPVSRLLSEAQITEIRRKRMLGVSWQELGHEHDMDERRICGIMRHQCLHRNWEWPIPVPGDY